jgi:DNA repair protein SbcC/Rad50
VRPLSLTIEGFTTFRDRQEIDFAPLELFVITGPTGAGKTSILDAISFALYGEVPRIGGTQGTADVISLGTDRATVQFEFQVGGARPHRVVRRISRRTSQTVTFERMEGEDWVPASTGGVRDTNGAIQELVGLDFDGFTRAVILPQGEFHRFLKGEPSERRKVLFSLLGVNYFQRMGRLARSKQTELEAGVKKTAALLEEHYADATSEHLEELRSTEGTARSKQTSASEALTIASWRAKTAEHAVSQIKVLGDARGEVVNLAQDLAGSLERIRNAEIEHAKATTSLQAKASELATARGAVDEADSELKGLVAEFGTLEAIAEITVAARTLDEVEGLEQQARQDLLEAEAADASARTEQATAEAEDTKAANELDSATAAERTAVTRAEEAHRAADALKLIADQAAARAAELEQAGQALTSVDAKVPALEAQAVERHRELDAAIEALDAHRRLHAVAELAEGLAPGDPCPVCGVPLSREVAVEPDAADALSTTRGAEESTRAAASQADKAVAAAQAERLAAVQRRDGCEGALTSALNGYADQPALATARSEADEALAAALVELEKRRELKTARQAERDRTREALTAAQLTTVQCDAAAESANKSILGIRARRDAAEHILRGRFGDVLPGDALDLLAADRSKVAATTETLERRRARYDTLSDEHDAAAALLTNADAKLTQIDLQLTTVATKLGSVATQATPAMGDSELEPPPALDGKREVSAQHLAAWCQAADGSLGECQAAAEADRDEAFAAVLVQAQNQMIDAADAAEALTLLKDGEQSAIKLATQALAAVEECERNIETRSKLEAEAKEDREQIAVLATLSQELQNNRFGEYIIEETLSLLSDHASGELKRISGGRYSLRPAKGEFEVIDHQNADERRSVRTLSGGETFLASLALALALSRHVGELASEGMGAKLESVFIDEGFGTLDPATLDEVIDALERLRAEELVVGVISHVPELAQRIQNGLEVRQVDGRSRIMVAGSEEAR